MELAKEVAAKGLTVREVERRVREGVGRPARPVAPPATRDGRPAEVRRIEDHLRRHFGTDVAVTLADRDRGEIRIAFYSGEDFERILDLLGARPE